MKNAMILLGLWIGIILTAYSLVYIDGGGPTPSQLALLERLAERTYVDPEGRFQFEAPPGWRVRETVDGVHLVDPLEKIEAWIQVIDDIGVARAIEIACVIASPCPGKEFARFDELAPPDFAERKVRITYDAEDEETTLYGIGFVLLRETIVLIVQGDRSACEQRTAELESIEGSLVAPAVLAPPEDAESDAEP